MNTNNINQSRNNGRSRYYHNHSQKNIILTDSEDQSKINIKDLSLFKMARAFNVKIDSRQRVRWYFNVRSQFELDPVQKNIEKICSRYGFVGKREITLIKDAGRNRLVIDTQLFLFNLDNIVQFSNELLRMATTNSIFYERWEVVPPQTTILSKITKFFN
jgi:hypothetical protein